VLEAIRIMSSTYNNRYTVSEPRWKTNREVSDLASANPYESRKDTNRLYQARGTCFSPYRLTVVYCLSEGAVEKSVLHVELLNRPVTGNSNGEHLRTVAGFTTGLNVSS
jgi:hypothetical protein